MAQRGLADVEDVARYARTDPQVADRPGAADFRPPAGEIVFENGRVRGIDEVAIRAEARELLASLRQDNEPAHEAAQRWLPYYRQMYLKAARRNVGINRWVSGSDQL